MASLPACRPALHRPLFGADAFRLPGNPKYFRCCRFIAGGATVTTVISRYAQRRAFLDRQ